MTRTINFSLNKIFILFLIALLGAAMFVQFKVAAQTEQPVSTDEATVAPAAMAQLQKLAAADGAASDAYGRAVAISGNTAVIGSPLADVNGKADRGVAYVYLHSNGAWTPQAKLLAPDGDSNHQFGYTLAIHGDTIVVGARQPASNDKGAAYVFVRSGGSWAPQAKLAANNGLPAERFGESVAISGNTIVVGAPVRSFPGLGNAGIAYVFTRSGATWTQQAELKASDAQAFDFFGSSVAIDTDTVIIGAPDTSNSNNFNPGSAYIFTRTGSVWSQQAKFLADDGADDDGFGGAVSVSGDTAVVGAQSAAMGGTKFSGKVYIFNRANGSWAQQVKLTGDTQSSELFGCSLSLQADTLAIGANGSLVDGKFQQGAVYLFKRVANGWTRQSKLLANDGAASDIFGTGVAIDGKLIIVGTPQKNVNSSNTADNPAHGTVYIFGEVANDGVPKIFEVKVKKKQLIVTGANFEAPSFVYLNGEKQKKSANDEANPTTVVIGLKAATLIAPGQTVAVQVKNMNTGKISDEFIFTRPLN
jgi:hypothetical protein